MNLETPERRPFFRSNFGTLVLMIGVAVFTIEAGRYVLGAQRAWAQQFIQQFATTPFNCATPTNSDTSVGLASTSVPATSLTQRRFITLTNSAENAGAPTVKCRIDGTAPVTGLGNPGDVLSVGSSVSYNVTSGVTVKCIASVAATHVTSLECQ